MSEFDSLIKATAGNLHAGQRVEAAREAADLLGVEKGSISNEGQALELCNTLLAYCLNSHRYGQAASLLWTSNKFSPEPRFTKLIWKNLDNNAAVMLMGSASSSKSYSAGVWTMLDWLRDPVHTNVKVIGPSEQHLRDNLFTHLVDLHQTASIPLPGKVQDLFIGLDSKARKSAISGVVIPIGNKAAGRLQGAKRVARPKPHPIFGSLTRMRVLIDEGENVPSGIWKDIQNILSQVSGAESFKIVVAFNPTNVAGQVGQRCEPQGGWDKGFDPDESEEWTSVRNWRVVRLDAMKGENIVEGKEIYPGLQTKEGIDAIIRDSGGPNSPGFFSMVRAMFPPEGVNYAAIPAHLLTNLKCEVVFLESPATAAGVDIALTGVAACPKMAVGRFGLASGLKMPPSLLYPKGAEIFFEDKNGQRAARSVLVLDALFTLTIPGGDTPTLSLAKEIKKQCERFAVRPEACMLDRTGNGAGVSDILRTIWSPEVGGVNYSEAATNMKILEEDEKDCRSMFDRVMSELWVALRKWIEFRFFFTSPMVDTSLLWPQLSGRLMVPGKLLKVEDKPAYKQRNNGQTPDDADAVTLLVHAVRKATGFTPSATGASDRSMVSDDPDDMPCRVDVSNQLDDDI